VLGKVCTAASHGKQLLSAGKKLLNGHLGGAVKTLLGSSTSKSLTISAALAAVGTWVFGGARFALHATASIVSATTTPQLTSSWFSSFYWRMAAVSALLTLPFLFAAAIQALMRSDLPLLMRAAFGYLPLGLLAVAIAAPVTTLLLAGSDELSHIVSGAAGHADDAFLIKASGVGALTLASKSPFLAFFVGLLTAGAALVLWCELLIRSAAVYVIVLMLPLFFAALVWPARRVWAVRAVEVLVALILSKFAIVAVLALGGAAIGHTLFPSFAAMLAGATLILLAAFSPWALLRMLPLHELAAGAAGGLRSPSAQLPLGAVGAAAGLAEAHADRMLGPGEAADEPPARAVVDRLEAPRGRDSYPDPAAGEVQAEAQAADAGPFDDAGQGPPAPVVEGGSDGEAMSPSGHPGVAVAAGEGSTLADGAEAQGPIAEAPDAERLSEEVGLMVRPGQTLHFSPHPEWAPETAAGAAGPAGGVAGPADGLAEPAGGLTEPAGPVAGPADGASERTAKRSHEPLPDEHDPLPPRQEPQDGRL
jgi:hypothetical protein